MKILIAIVVVVVALLFASGNITFQFSLDSNEPAAASGDGGRSVTVRDVLTVINAGAPRSTDVDVAQMRGLFRRVSIDRDRAAIHLLEREWPRLWPRLDRKIGQLSTRVARVPVTTKVGQRCRVVLLHLLARQRLVLQGFTTRVRQRGATVKSVERFGARMTGLPLDACTAGAKRQDRAAIEAAFG